MPTIFRQNCRFFENCCRNTTASMETFTENKLRPNSALHFTSYLSIALSKILSHSKTIKSPKKLSVFGENDSRRLSSFLQTHIFWKFDHISRTYNQINYRNIWFAKVTIILIMMAQVLFSIFFPKKTRTLMPLRVTSEVEAVANSWPLKYMYQDEVEEVLTPSHLYCGKQLID